MKRLIACVALVLLASGCARFNTSQKELRYDDHTEITTKATAYTLLAGKSALANWQASQSDGEQSAEVGSLEQETQAATNVTAALEAVLAIVQAIK